jgi:LuxR family maltose regulon positive regulatory protein
MTDRADTALASTVLASTALAETKLSPPTLPSRLVPRSRLDVLLDASLTSEIKMALVSAPAGSGKSTLLASWLASQPQSSAWLQVERSDSDPTRFWVFLARALSRIDPTLSTRLEPLIVSSNRDADLIVTALVNELAALPEPLIIVLDDYHLIENPSIHEGMERLIELCPPSTTIVLSTRVDPPFRLGRLRVRHQITEVRASDVRFEPGEAAGLLGPDPVRGGLVERLVGRTEGWAAGLVLAGLSLQRATDPEQFVNAFHGNDELVVDYMTDEFLAGEDDDTRQRLLQTSVLEQFNGALVDAVTGTTGGSQWLIDTARTNQLLISLDRTNTWFRYHHLLRDLLRLEAHQTIPERLGELHQRAASWFEGEGDDRHAIGHHLAAGNDRAAIRLIYRVGPQLIADSQIDTLQDLLVSIGEPAKTDPACTLSWGWCHYIGGRYAQAAEWVAITHDLASPDFDPIITAPLRMNLSLAQGDVGTALTLAREARAADHLVMHRPELATTVGGAFMWAGQADEAREALDIAVEKSVVTHFRSTHLLATIHQAINAFDATGSTTEAEAALTTATESGLSTYHRLAPAYAIRGRGTSDPARARADVTHAIEMARKAPGDLALAYVLTTCGDTLLDLGDTGGQALVVEARTVIDRCPDPGIAGRYLARIESKHRIAVERPRPVDTLVEQLTERETAVLRYLPTALSQRDIGAELFVSPNTVKTHCSAIYRKLAVGDRKAAVQAARDLGLL